MKVLLMVPVTSLMKNHPAIPDLGLGYLATALRKAGFHVELLGWDHHLTRHQFQEYLKQMNPRVVGVKVFTHNFRAARQTLAIIKAVNPSIITIIGGPHPSAEDPEKTMSAFIDADYAFAGDAETGLPDLVRVLSQNDWRFNYDQPSSETLKTIPGLVWRTQLKIESNPAFFVENLDELGYPGWDLIDPRTHNFHRIDENDRRGCVAPLMITRGCPLKCTYCSVALVNGRKIRRRSIESVLGEIELLYRRYDVRQLSIMDASFLSDKRYVADFCKGLINQNLPLKWDCTCDTLDRGFYDHDILALMARAGCCRIILGIESGSDKILKIIGKTWNRRQFEEVVYLIKSHGIATHGFFMYGFPQETLRDIKETREFAFRLELDKRIFNLCFPLPGTEIYRQLKAKYCIEGIQWDEFTVESSPYPVGEVPSGTLMKMLYLSEWRDLLDSFRKRRGVAGGARLLGLSKLAGKMILLHLFHFSKKIRQC